MNITKQKKKKKSPKDELLKLAESLLADLEKKLKNNPAEISLGEKLCLFLTGAPIDATALIDELTQYQDQKFLAEDAEDPSFFKTPINFEIFENIANFLNAKDLSSIEKTSKKLQVWTNSYLATHSKKLLLEIMSADTSHVMNIIHSLRSTAFYKYLVNANQNNSDELSTEEILLYALTTNDVKTIHYKRLDHLLDALKKTINHQMELHPHPTPEEIKEQNYFLRLIQSLEITVLLAKRAALQQKILTSQNELKRGVDHIDRLFLENDLITQLKSELKSDPAFSFLHADVPDDYFSYSDYLKYLEKNMDYQIYFKIEKLNAAQSQNFCNLAGADFRNWRFGKFVDWLSGGIPHFIGKLTLWGFNLENADFSENENCVAKDLRCAHLKNADFTCIKIDKNEVHYDSHILAAKIANACLVPLDANWESIFDHLDRLKELFKQKKGQNIMDPGALLAQTIVLDLKRRCNHHTMNGIKPLTTIKKIKKHDIFKERNKKEKLSFLFSSSAQKIFSAFEKEIKNNPNFMKYEKGISAQSQSPQPTFSPTL